VNVAQKNLTGGYLPTAGNPPSALVLQALDSVDAFLAAFISKLKARNLYDSTLIIVASKHGQAPINPTLFKGIDPDLVTAQVGVPIAHQTSDDIALIWLNSTSDINTATENLARNASALRILNIFTGANASAFGFGSPYTDERVPAVIVQPEVGTIFTTSKKKMAEHGGLSNDDRNVACFFSHPSLKKTVFDEMVATTQIAPTVLRVLGLDPRELEAVVAQGVQVLPGFAW
jgi:predicted AlkP superfamily pyrophosphatase or phosphodiesterase